MITTGSALAFAIILALILIVLYVLFKNTKKSIGKLKELLESDTSPVVPRSPSPDKDFQLLQYKLRMEQWTSLSQIEWQIATIAVAVTVGVLAAALTYIHNPLFSGLTLIGGGALDFSLASAISKNHLLGDSLQAYVLSVERDMGIHHIPMEAVKLLQFQKGLGRDITLRSRNKFLLFFQTRALGDILAVSLFIFSVSLVVVGLLIILNGSISQLNLVIPKWILF